jgi:predicted metalloendopeptidase
MKRLLPLVLLVSCHHASDHPAAATKPKLYFSVDLMDLKADPCDDFYRYVCGGWLDRTKVDDAHPVAMNFFQDDRTPAQLQEVLDAASKERGNALGDFWASCLDDKRDDATLTDEIARIDAITDGASLAREVARLHLGGALPLFQFQALPDVHDPTHVIGHLSEAGLGMSQWDGVVVEQDAKAYAAPLDDYTKHVEKMLQLTKGDAARAGAVVAIEKRLAAATMPEDAQNDMKKQDHPMARAELPKGFDWDAYLAALGHPGVAKFDVEWPQAIAAAAQVASDTPLADMKAYLRWQYVHIHATAIGGAIATEENGAEGRSRRELCLDETNRWMGESLGMAWVAKDGGGASRDEAVALVKSVEATMSEHLRAATWLDDETRARAATKLALVGNAMGYPKAREIHVAVDRGRFLAGTIAAAEEQGRYRLGWLDAPTDRDALAWRWMRAQQLGAVYEVQSNTMVFPGAVLVPPYFVRGADELNLPSIGWAMAHELTHAFDSDGHSYDGNGALTYWFTPAAEKAFDDRASCFIDQYDAIEVAPGVHLQGARTLHEDIADNGATAILWDAWKAARRGKPPLPKVAGLDDDQQFFVTMGQTCEKVTDERGRKRVDTATHSPWRQRTEVTLQNLPAFAEAFHCKAGARMAPAKRCTIW